MNNNKKENRDDRDREDRMGAQAQDNLEGTQTTGSAQKEKQDSDSFGRDES